MCIPLVDTLVAVISSRVKKAGKSYRVTGRAKKPAWLLDFLPVTLSYRRLQKSQEKMHNEYS